MHDRKLSREYISSRGAAVYVSWVYIPIFNSYIVYAYIYRPCLDMRLYCIYDANTVCTTKNPYNKRSAHVGLTDLRELGYIRIDIHTQVHM